MRRDLSAILVTWGLRDYQTATWEGGDGSECEHKGPPQQSSRSTLAGNGHGNGKPLSPSLQAQTVPYRHTCAKCGARRVDGQIGLEPTPEEYLTTMVEVFRLVREVLADDGVAFINMGDLFVDKQLQGMPWRLAFALQADGWWLRSDIIWAKPNPMPESCTDRPTKSHEYLFLLTKSPRYYYDAEAVREAHSENDYRQSRIAKQKGRHDSRIWNTRSDFDERNPAGRNRRTVWTIATEAFPGAHFATFPRKLVEPCILAGTSTRGHCPECGARWVRVVEREFEQTKGNSNENVRKDPGGMDAGSGMTWPLGYGRYNTTTLDWRPTCQHNLEPFPDVCLDPFAGTGTVGLVAAQLGRKFILIELSPEYEKMQKARTAQTGMAL